MITISTYGTEEGRDVILRVVEEALGIKLAPRRSVHKGDYFLWERTASDPDTELVFIGPNWIPIENEPREPGHPSVNTIIEVVSHTRPDSVLVALQQANIPVTVFGTETY